MAITTPTEPVKPCRNLPSKSISMLGAKAQMMPEMTHSKLPTMSGNLRPIVSLIGPPNNWPTATPKVIIPMVI